MAKIQGHISLTGDHFDIDHISKVQGMEPTSVHSAQDLSRSGKQYGYCEWTVSVCSHTSCIQSVLDTLLAPFFQHAEQMRQLAQEQNAAWDVQLCVDLTEPIFPTITFDSKIIAFLSTIEAKLDTDVYSVFDFDHV